MNVKNNKRRKESQNKIEKAFVNMLLTKNINKISVTDICKETCLNRTTFYANYIDVYDLADKIRKNLENEFHKTFLLKENHTATTFFKLIYENQLMFKVYFKLGYDQQKYDIYDAELAKKFFNLTHIKYHVEFFKSGLNAIIKMWLDDGCKETPEEMASILENEYMGRVQYFEKQ